MNYGFVVSQGAGRVAVITSGQPDWRYGRVGRTNLRTIARGRTVHVRPKIGGAS